MYPPSACDPAESGLYSFLIWGCICQRLNYSETGRLGLMGGGEALDFRRGIMKEAKAGKLQGWWWDSKLGFDLFMHVTHKYQCLLWASTMPDTEDTTVKRNTLSPLQGPYVEGESQLHLYQSGEMWLCWVTNLKPQWLQTTKSYFSFRQCDHTRLLARALLSFIQDPGGYSTPHLETHRPSTGGKGSPGGSLFGS